MQKSMDFSPIINELRSGENQIHDLAGMDLSSIDLSGLTLKNIVFSDFNENKFTNLTNANF